MIEKCSQETLARLWAAYIVRYDDDQRLDFERIAQCLDDALVEQDVHGDVLVRDVGTCVEDMAQVGVAGLCVTKDIKMTLGRKAKVELFMKDVCGAYRAEHQ